MATCRDKEFDLAIVDPPYGIKRLGIEENRDPNSKYRRSIALDKEGNLIYAGDPDREDEDSRKELLNLIEKEYNVKTIAYSDYLKLNWK